MAENRFSRYRFTVRRGILIVTGQKKTMRGVQYDLKQVAIPLVDKSVETYKKAMAEGIEQLG